MHSIEHHSADGLHARGALQCSQIRNQSNPWNLRVLFAQYRILAFGRRQFLDSESTRVGRSRRIFQVSSSRLDLIILDTVLIHFFVLPSFPRRIPMVTGQCEDEGTLFSLTNANITTNSQAMTYMRENYVPLGNAEELAELFQLYPRDPTIGSPYNTTVLNQLTPQFKRRKLP
jgi:hypothetical protein